MAGGGQRLGRVGWRWARPHDGRRLAAAGSAGASPVTVVSGFLGRSVAGSEWIHLHRPRDGRIRRC
uniref:Uncharacterized protein n=1 Tax=Oryza punctata TaxID=4537 RepID=A0A0E0MF26_ORYPU